MKPMELVPGEPFYIPRSLCMSCGVCVPSCHLSIIQIDNGGFGYPYLVDETCDQCNVCIKVCPGESVDFERLAAPLAGPRYHPYVGYYRDVLVGHARDPVTRERASSGGIISALIAQGLRAGDFEAALMVGMQEGEPWKARPILVTGPEAVGRGSQSKYQLVSVYDLLEKALEYRRIAIVGLPCQIEGARKLEPLNRRLRERLALRVGLFCGYATELEGTLFLFRKLKVKPEEVAAVEYRGRGFPGGLVVRLKDGRTKFLSKADYSLLNVPFIPDRCLPCIDHTSELADLSVGDAWFKRDGQGWSAIIVRTEAGQRALDRLVLSGGARVEPCRLEELLATQQFFLDLKKVGAPMRIARMAGPKPQYRIGPPVQVGWRTRLVHWLLSLVLLHRRAFIPVLERLPLSLLTFTSRVTRRLVHRTDLSAARR